MIWAVGLRGAVAYGLALNLPQIESESDEGIPAIESATLVIVVLSTLILGSATGPLLRRFDLQVLLWLRWRPLSQSVQYKRFAVITADLSFEEVPAVSGEVTQQHGMACRGWMMQMWLPWVTHSFTQTSRHRQPCRWSSLLQVDNAEQAMLILFRLQGLTGQEESSSFTQQHFAVLDIAIRPPQGDL